MLLSAAFAIATGVSAENLTYRILYHLGFIDKEIATGYVHTSLSGNNYFATLNGHSIPWGGRLYTVSDTLRAVMTPDGALPYKARESVEYINGWYSKPYAHNGVLRDYSNPAEYKNIKGGGALSASYETMEAVSVTSSMLGMFYYFRVIDFDKMQPGATMLIPITGSGPDGNMVKVTYHGTSSYDPGSGEQATYNVEFEYSYGGALCNYPVSCEVSQQSRVPLLLSAQLKIGHVEMILD